MKIKEPSTVKAKERDRIHHGTGLNGPEGEAQNYVFRGGPRISSVEEKTKGEGLGESRRCCFRERGKLTNWEPLENEKSE